MLNEILKLFIPYVVLFISFGIMKICDSVELVWRKNIITFLIGLLGTIIFVYSFFKIGRESASYVKNIFENLNITSRTGLMNEIMKIVAPMVIFSIIAAISLKLSDLYKKKNRNNIYSMTIRLSVFSTWGAFVIMLTTVIMSIHTL